MGWATVRASAGLTHTLTTLVGTQSTAWGGAPMRGAARFLPFLPPPGGGEAAVDGEGAEALIFIAEDLQWLLASDAAEFWGVARSDASLPTLVDTFLRYARCRGGC